jgi:hypothetical protein
MAYPMETSSALPGESELPRTNGDGPQASMATCCAKRLAMARTTGINTTIHARAITN